MNFVLPIELTEVTRLTKAGQLTEATATLQRVLGADMPPSKGTATAGGPPAPAIGKPFGVGAEGSQYRTRTRAMKPALAAALRGLVDTTDRSGSQPPAGLGTMSPLSAQADIPDGARFLTCSFSNQAGSRPYKLYVPAGYRGQPVPLIVMLHGCTQSPDDFAAGTRMNVVAEEHGCLVAYPGQTSSANMQKCWNWFRAGDQQRDAGEPSLIAGITREVMRHYAVDPRRVFIAGLSAGGAAAAIMGDAYPELYAAIGVHSGLACGAARDMPSAFAAMQGNGGQAPPSSGTRARTGLAASRIVPAIVFHGDRDTTVDPSNADSVVAQSGQGTSFRIRVEKGRAAGGLAYSRMLHADTSGETVVEQWVVHGAGHAWSGGSTAGSYTLPGGPDATREMVRFFLEHPLPAGMRHG